MAACAPDAVFKRCAALVENAAANRAMWDMIRSEVSTGGRKEAGFDEVEVAAAVATATAEAERKWQGRVRTLEERCRQLEEAQEAVHTTRDELRDDAEKLKEYNRTLEKAKRQLQRREEEIRKREAEMSDTMTYFTTQLAPTEQRRRTGGRRRSTDDARGAGAVEEATGPPELSGSLAEEHASRKRKAESPAGSDGDSDILPQTRRRKRHA